MRFFLPTIACLALGFAGVVVGSALSAQQAAETSAAAKFKLPPGYLPITALPDSLTLLPAPPEPGSAAFAQDEHAHARAAALRNTPRWTVAASDADLHFPHAASLLSCAADLSISKDATPRLYGLLGRMFVDVGLSTYRAKDHYKRTRPFVLHKEATCTPTEDTLLSADGSYPSGHSAVGWGWALVLTELVPSRADTILRRGRDFGESRVVCDAHWQSDVDAGRVIAAATVARLHADAIFAADLAAAKAEVAAAPRGAVTPDACAAQAAALASGP